MKPLPPRRARRRPVPPALHLAVAVALGGAGVAFLIAPRLIELVPGGSLNAGRRNEEIRMLRTAQTALAERDAAARALPADFQNRIFSALPRDAALPDAVVLFDGFAKRVGVILRSVRVDDVRRASGPAEKAPGVAPRRFHVALENVTYERLKSFIEALERSAWLMQVQTIVYTPEFGAASLTVTAYALPE